MSIDNLRGFVDLNVGKWTGSFHQFDGDGNLLHKIDTRLSASSYGEDELISLNQSLYIKQATSGTSVVEEEEEEEAEWVEYKIKETNMFTVDKYQQSADWILPQGESIFTEVSDRWNVGYHVKARRSRRR